MRTVGKPAKFAKDDAAGWRKEARRQRNALAMLTLNVRAFLDRLDEAIKEPSTVERGKKIAQLANALEMANDTARYGALDIDFRTDKKGCAMTNGGTGR